MKRLPVTMKPQPDDRTCGATCLDAVYRHYGDDLGLERLAAEIPQLAKGGTLGVYLANHALERGYDAEILTYNLQIFDPSWFRGEVDLAEKLRLQATKKKKKKKLRRSTEAYLEYLQLGGHVLSKELTAQVIFDYLDAGVPVLTGLSATYLYQSQRERPETDKEDDVRGEPVGHFVVLIGHERSSNRIWVADPVETNPFSQDRYYTVTVERLIGAILLGIVTYDANLVVIRPKRSPK